MDEAAVFRMCVGKHVFVKRGVANKRAKVLSRELGRDMRAYRCPNCGKYHLTSKPMMPTRDRWGRPVPTFGTGAPCDRCGKPLGRFSKRERHLACELTNEQQDELFREVAAGKSQIQVARERSMAPTLARAAIRAAMKRAGFKV